MGVTRDRMRTIMHKVEVARHRLLQIGHRYEEKEGGEETGLLFSGTVAAEDATL